MLGVFAVVALVLVFAIAAVVIGRESNRLAAQPPRPVFDLDEAVEWVAARVPFEVSAVLSHDDVRDILRWNLEVLDSVGMSVPAPPEGDRTGPEAPEELVVVGGREAVEAVLRRAGDAARDLTPEQVGAVLDAQLDYLGAIGAVGPLTPQERPPA
ncbi:MAG: hypothetical protein KY450_08820 [Actinobacteria bacterium]|nr:hypothetical protein [Actinomycetota bacterium]